MTDSARRLSLAVIPGVYAVARLPAGATLPAWATGGRFFSVAGTPHEVSIVCETGRVPDGVLKEDGWRGLMVEGRLDFGMTGVLAGLTAPLAAAGISTFVLSTYDTDYVLVRDRDLTRAVIALREAGHTVSDALGPASRT